MNLTQEGYFLGPLLFRWGGLLIIFGVAAGLLLAAHEAKKNNYDVGIISDLFLPLIIWGTIGARLWHILTPPLSSAQLGLTTQYYLSHPVDILSLWIGGFGIAGAWIGGIVALYFFARANENNFWELADLLAPGLALAQAIGRMGNYFNQELYGLPANLPWKIFIEPAYRLVGFETVETYHPLFAYEVMLNFATMVFLLWFARRFVNNLKAGDLFLAYIGLYSFFRLFLEFLRLDVAFINGININQVFFSLTLFCAGIGSFLRHRIPQKL
ncbi:MAG: prolipoprotein diacylglyceryl transferase [Anaerolineales bacterium]|nr:prolipoprotein diacylglyceryl transferase [Anaerolineales bacterium]